jgi:hypothetical protein
MQSEITIPWCPSGCHDKKHSASGHLQRSFRKVGPLDFQPGNSFVDLLEVILGQLDAHRAEVFLEPMQLGGAWDRYDPLLLRQ